jgi:hypothetical protein
VKKEAFNTLTGYTDVNELLFFATSEITQILADNVVGFYLTGSLTYNDFVPGRSDIDLLVVIENALSKDVINLIAQFHNDLESRYLQWAERVECSYLPIRELSNIQPPKAPRPYFGEGMFYAEAPYGNEWIINRYFLYNYGINLIGPDFKIIAEPVNFDEVRMAAINDFFKEWMPKTNDHKWLGDSHFQSYLVLNLCRILKTVIGRQAVSKTESALWVVSEFPQWSKLVKTAMQWRYGLKMAEQEKVIEFIRFVGKTINNED